jgi:capsular polysaccharide transport system permease protein
MSFASLAKSLLPKRFRGEPKGPGQSVSTKLAARAATPSRAVLPGDAAQAFTQAASPNLYRERIQQRRRRTRQAFLVVVIVPTFVAAAYYGLVASDRYVSEAQFVVNVDSPDTSGTGSGAVGAGSISEPGTLVLYNYIQSMEIMNKLDERIELRKRFATDKADYFSRLSPTASQEDAHDYFLNRVHVIGEPTNPILTVRVEGFTPQDAQEILNAIVQISSDRLNTLLSKRQVDTITFAESLVERARSKLLDVQARLTSYRIEHSEIDPIDAAGGIGGVVTTLTQSIADERANLQAMLSDLRPNSPKIKAATAKIAGLEAQLDKARDDLAGKSGQTYASLVSQYETLKGEEDMNQKEYAETLQFLDLARADAARQHSYVLDFVSPNLPQESTEPQRIRSVLTVFAIALLAFGIGQLVVLALREQAGL